MTSWVEDDGAMRALALAIDDTPIAVDAEGDGLFRYRARLCTLQIATERDIFVIDTLAVPLERIAEALGARGPRKILHDAAFDARLLWESGIMLDRVFDTAIAARFLGETATGLASLAQKYLGVTLSKEKQHQDWGKRPVDAESLVYLEDDVRYLHEIASALLVKVCELGIESEVAEECDYALRRARDAVAGPSAFRRITGALELAPVERAILHALCELRERVAAKMDVPPFKVMGNDVLYAIAKKNPRSMRDLMGIPGVAKGRARALGRELMTTVVEARELGDAPASELERGEVPSRDERSAQRARHKSLSNWRKKTAEARSVNPQVVLPGHCLNDLVDSGAARLDDIARIDGIGAFRVERDGPAILAALRV